MTIRDEAYHVVVCTDSGSPPSQRVWVLARVLDRHESPFFFTEDQALDIADAINGRVEGTTAEAVEWFAADIATPVDATDAIVADVLRGA